MNRVLLLLILLALPAATQDAKGTLTFTHDIAPILFNRCAACHHPGESGPFPLLTYEDARKRSKQLLEVVEKRRMPPWKAEHGYGEFFGERRLSDAEIALMRAWVEAGSPEGDPKDLPSAPTFPSDWEYGKPDLVLKMTEPYELGAEERDTLRAFPIPMNLTEDRYIRAFQFRPQNRRVVHHAVFYIDSLGLIRKKAAEDPRHSVSADTIGPFFAAGGSLGAWGPGGDTPPFEEDRGMLVRKGSDLIMHLHFTPTGKVEHEQSTMAIWLTKEPPKKRVEAVYQNDPVIFLPAGEVSEKGGIVKLPVDMEIIALTPHAHFLAREFQASAKTPEGRIVPILWIKDWDFDWQMEYRFKEPIRLPKGTELMTRWRYDNTSGNPRNPHVPPQDVHFGFRSTDEMALSIYRITPDHPDDVVKLNFALKLIKRQ